jgi:hypothetical protein
MKLLLALAMVAKSLYEAGEAAFLEWWHSVLVRIRPGKTKPTSVFDEPVPEPKWKPSPRLLKMFRIGWAVTIVSVALGSIALGWRKMNADPMAVYLPMMTAIGEATAEEIGKVAGYGDKIVVITYDAETMKYPLYKTEWRGFKSALGRSTRAEIVGVEEMKLDDDLTGATLRLADVQRITAKYERVDAIVSMVGLPVMAGSNTVGPGKAVKLPKIIAVNLDGDNLDRATWFRHGTVAAVIVPRNHRKMIEEERPKTIAEWRDRYVEVVRAPEPSR